MKDTNADPVAALRRHPVNTVRPESAGSLSRKQREARDARRDLGMVEALEALLNDLDRVARYAPEIVDTAVREALHEAIDAGFVRQEPGYRLPRQFELFTPRANARVRAVLEQFLERARPAARRDGLLTPRARLSAFQSGSARSDAGSSCAEYFGHREEA